jgi:hypothetical protein
MPVISVTELGALSRWWLGNLRGGQSPLAGRFVRGSRRSASLTSFLLQLLTRYIFFARIVSDTERIMEPYGTSCMYQQQMPAFSIRDELGGGLTTNSTPDDPPQHESPDWIKLCELKRSIVQNLPTTCSHCGSGFPDGSIVERRDGDIVAYCKASGACGRSLVLFAAVDRSYPVYKKFCPFRAVEPSSAEAQEESVSGPPDRTPELPQSITMQEVLSRTPLDIYALHGITPPHTLCSLCDKGYQAHEQGCDQNGWKEVGRRLYALPADWPNL